MSRRKLSADERELWSRVARQTERLHPVKPIDPVAELETPPVSAKQPKVEDRFEIHADFGIGNRASKSSPGNHLTPTISDQLARKPVQMDNKAFTKMKRGKLKPEGKLDLHGMRVDTAHPALVRFVLRAHSSGKRLVLVITGKGKDRDEPGPIPTPRGVLRHQVPQWLSLPPLAGVVMQVTPAHLSHGGDGAYYVYLRRKR